MTLQLSDESEQFLESDLAKLEAGPDTREAFLDAQSELNKELEFEFEGTVKEFKVPSRDVPGISFI